MGRWYRLPLGLSFVPTPAENRVERTSPFYFRPVLLEGEGRCIRSTSVVTDAEWCSEMESHSKFYAHDKSVLTLHEEAGQDTVVAVLTARTFSQVSHKLGIIVPGLMLRFTSSRHFPLALRRVLPPRPIRHSLSACQQLRGLWSEGGVRGDEEGVKRRQREAR